MSQAIATGLLHGRIVTLTWEDGKLTTSDPVSLLAVRAAIRAQADTCLPGITGGPASLESAEDAAATFLVVLDETTRLNVESDAPDLPEGAIA